MIQFLKNFLYEGFIPGDYTYGFVHIFSIVAMLVSIGIAIYYLRGKDAAYINKRMKVLAIVTLTIYFLRRGVDIYQGKNVIKALWPFYICNVNTIFMSIYILFDIKKGKDFFMITGLAGAVLMFVVPEGVFNDRYLTLSILDSLLSHYAIIFIPIVLMATRTYKLNIKNSWQVILGLLLVLFNVEVLQQFLINEQVDYLFLDGTLPFTIEGVNQIFIMFPTAVVFVYLVYFLNHLYNSNAVRYNQLKQVESR